MLVPTATVPSPSVRTAPAELAERGRLTISDGTVGGEEFTVTTAPRRGQ